MGRLISGERAAACITDPPFNVSIKGFANRSSKHAEFAMASGEMSEEEFEIFMRESLSLAASYRPRRQSISYSWTGVTWKSSAGSGARSIILS